MADRLAEARASRGRDERARDRDRDQAARPRPRPQPRRPARDADRDHDSRTTTSPRRCDQIARPAEPTRSAIRRPGTEAALSRSPVGDAYPTRDNLALAPAARAGDGAPRRAAPRPSRSRGRRSSADDRRYQITTLHPTTYSEARTIGEHFRDGVPVILNLTEMDEADAKRLVDFAAGLAFGLRGTMERVTNRVFLLSPANIQVTRRGQGQDRRGRISSTSDSNFRQSA